MVGCLLFFSLPSLLHIPSYVPFIITTFRNLLEEFSGAWLCELEYRMYLKKYLTSVTILLLCIFLTAVDLYFAG